MALRLRTSARLRTSQRPRSSSQFRPDIEGLRAVAVLAVLLFHAGLPAFPGGYVGVDVFFVISGFLITGLLVRDLDSGRIDLIRFYAQRARRLLPALLLVLVAVVAAAVVLFRPIRTAAVAQDVLAAATYVINWKFAFAATDYFAESAQVSPLQHIWSLAVEEQFYLVWPALLIGAAWWQRRTRRPDGPQILVGGMALVTAASFLYNLHLTATDAGPAYFSTFTRAWELGVGGLLAMLLLVWRPGPRLAVALSVAGGSAIVAAIVLVTEETPFPGVAAIPPVLGAAAIIAAGAGSRLVGPQRLLTLPPLRHIGRISYAWYLWHWPVLVIATSIWGRLSTPASLLAVAASYPFAVGSTYLVEDRIRHQPRLTATPWRALRLGLACTLLAVAAGVGLQLSTPTIREAAEPDAPGGKVLAQDQSLQRQISTLRPRPDRADKDRGPLQSDGCVVSRKDTESGDCTYGDPDADTTVVLFGDSHAMQWFPALDKVAAKHNWKIIALTKVGCQPADVTIYSKPLERAYVECDEWRQKALSRIEATDPDLVIMSSWTTYTVLDGDEKLGDDRSAEELERGYSRVIEQLQGIADQVVAIDDIPMQRNDVVDCVAGRVHDLEPCATDKSDAGDTPLGRAAQDERNDATLVDPLPVLCPADKCPAVIGNVLVYRDTNHLTATYVASLDEWLESELPFPSSSE